MINIKMNSVQVPRIRNAKIISRFCFDDCIATYTEYIQSDYKMIFLDCWNVSWNSDESLPFVKRIRYINREHKNLEKYYGIILKFRADPIEQAIDAIGAEIRNGSPVGIIIDSYYCPWERGYKIVHSEGKGHAAMVTGIDEEKNELYFMDPYFNAVNQRIGFEDLKLGYKEYFMFHREEIKSSYDVEEEILKRIEANVLTEYFNNMACMVKEFEDIELIQRLLFGEDTQAGVDLNYTFGNIVDARVHFLVLINSLAEENTCRKEELLSCQEKLLDIVEQLNICHAIITKALIRGKADSITDKIPGRLKEILEKERQVMSELADVLQTKEDAKQLTSCEGANKLVRKKKKKNMKYQYLALDQYYNNEGIAAEDSKTADLTGANEYIFERTFPRNGIINVNDLSFLLAKKEGEPDNICCNYQKISLEEEFYNEVMLLGCSEWGSFSDDIIICYEDGSQDVFHLAFLDFIVKTEIGDENMTVCNYATIKWVDGKKEHNDSEHHLYANTFLMNSEKKAKAIILPGCPNMHVFAITLVNYEECE